MLRRERWVIGTLVSRAHSGNAVLRPHPALDCGATAFKHRRLGCAVREASRHATGHPCSQSASAFPQLETRPSGNKARLAVFSGKTPP